MELLKKCPYCGEMIKQEAKKCRYCGEWIDQLDMDSHLGNNMKEDVAIKVLSFKMNSLFNIKIIDIALFVILIGLIFKGYAEEDMAMCISSELDINLLALIGGVLLILGDCFFLTYLYKGIKSLEKSPKELLMATIVLTAFFQILLIINHYYDYSSYAFLLLMGIAPVMFICYFMTGIKLYKLRSINLKFFGLFFALYWLVKYIIFALSSQNENYFYSFFFGFVFSFMFLLSFRHVLVSIQDSDELNNNIYRYSILGYIDKKMPKALKVTLLVILGILFMSFSVYSAKEYSSKKSAREIVEKALREINPDDLQ